MTPILLLCGAASTMLAALCLPAAVSESNVYARGQHSKSVAWQVIASPRTVPHLQDPAQLALYSRGSTTLAIRHGWHHSPRSPGLPSTAGILTAGHTRPERAGISKTALRSANQAACTSPTAVKGSRRVLDFGSAHSDLRLLRYPNPQLRDSNHRCGAASHMGRLQQRRYRTRTATCWLRVRQTGAVQESTPRGYFFMSDGMGNEPLSLAQGPGTTAYVVEPCDRRASSHSARMAGITTTSSFGSTCHREVTSGTGMGPLRMAEACVGPNPGYR